MPKIIGVESKQGVYEGAPYHNAYFNCTTPIESDKGAGLRVERIKVKHQVIVDLLGKHPTDKDLQSFVGKEVDFLYNKFQTVVSVVGLTT